MKKITFFSVIAVMLLFLIGTQSSVGGPLAVMLILFIAMLAVAIHEARLNNRGPVGLIVNLVLSVIGGFLAASVASLGMEKLLSLVQFQGSLAASQSALLYILSAAMAVVTVFGSWAALQFANRFRSASPHASPADVLKFWREAGPDRWWKKDAVFDHAIYAKFHATWEAARDGKLSSWQDSDDGALALVIVLDQFPRNMFRNDPKMFATDAMAVDVAARAIAEGRDDRTPKELLAFLYMPYMHTETLAGQTRCVELFTKLGDPFNLKFAKEHAEIIERFGRFPHRNATLGRASTAEETKFLADGGFAG